MNTPALKLGYLGLGIMGLPMTLNLLKAGHSVKVWNRTFAKAAPALAAGATAGSTPAEVAAACDIVFLNVTDTPDVEALLFGTNGVLAGAKPGLIVVDNSTISPVATREFACRLQERGVLFLDAPVSGGDIGAKNGTLSIMVGGDAAAFEKITPVLAAMGKNIQRLGEVGAGQACKACNQICVLGNLLATCEAIKLARSFGLDVEKMAAVVSGGAGGSWQLQNLGPKIAKGDFAPAFMIDLALKDLAIVLDAAQKSGYGLPGTELANERLKAAKELGGGRQGTQAMSKAV